MKKPPGAMLAKIRWDNATEQDREQSRINGRKGGRPRSATAPRCPCGAMTATMAKARSHKCLLMQ